MAGSASLRSQAVRFIAVGGLNTIVTYSIFIALGLVVNPGIAYTVSFAIGLVWVAFGSSKFVFGHGTGFARIFAFAAWYVLVYGAGRMVIHVVQPVGFIELALTSGAILLVTTPLSFIGGRWIFHKPDRSPERKA